MTESRQVRRARERAEARRGASKTTRNGVIYLNDEDSMMAHWMKEPGLPQNFGKGTETQGPCLKCKFQNEDETFGGHETPMMFSKTIAESMTVGKTPRVIPRKLLGFCLWKNEFSEEHVSHVANVDKPGIIVMGALRQDDKNMMFCYLIDGTHRAAACVRTGRDFKAYILTAKESAMCAERTREMIEKERMIFVDPTPKDHKVLTA